MELTYSLLHNLTEQERDLLRYYLSYSYNNNKGRENKLLKLADYLLASKIKPSYKDCLEEIYGKGETGKKITNLKTRLLSRVLDLFALEPELQRNEELDEQDLSWIIAKKKLTQFYTLFYSGREIKLSLHLLEEAIEISKNKEHYIVLIECLRFKKWIIGLKNGMDQFSSIQEEIKHYEFCSKTVGKAVDLFYTMGISSVYSSATNKRDRSKVLKQKIQEINKDNKVAGSKVAEYYIKILETGILINSGDYSSARNKFDELSTFIQSSKAVFRKSRLALNFCNLSRCELFLNNFDKAVNFANSALKFYLKGSINYYIAQEQKLYALFYNDKIRQALPLTEELISNSVDEVGDFRNAKYVFFSACIFFKNGEYERCLSTIKSINDLTKDKAGWDISIRFIRIMCNIELGKSDVSISLIETLRRHVNIHSVGTEYYARYKLIVTLFKELEKQGFLFNNSTQKLRSLVSLLKEEKHKQSWEFLGPELIPIHKWVENKFQ